MRGGGDEGACGRGAVAWAQASQGGLVVRPAKGVGSRWRLGRGPGGSGVIGYTVAGSLGHAQWSMTHSHSKAPIPAHSLVTYSLSCQESDLSGSESSILP